MKNQRLNPNIKKDNRKTKKCFSYLKILSVAFILSVSSASYAQTGTWTALTNKEPNENMGAMLLLTDGTVICHNSTGGSEGDGTGWDKLTPSATGSYLNGTWTTLASMNQERTVFPSQVLPNGKVWVAGGEYGEGDTAGEIYDPVANTWTRTEKVPGTQYNTAAGTSDNIYDGNSEMLPDGRILVGPQVGPDPSFDCLYYTPSTNTWAVAPTAPENHDEAAWLKLPDSSILFVGIATCKSCRYRPQTGTWIADANLPDSIFDVYGEESGSAHLLPNGKAIFFGATGHNCMYTPSGTAAPGSWVRVADFPFIGGKETGMVDAPSVMLPNGHILMAVSPIGTSSNNEFLTPTYFLEYNYLTNTFTQVTSTLPGIGTDDIAGLICQQALLLLLPDGTALMGINQDGTESKQYFIYTESTSTSPIAAGKPVINSILPDGCPYYKLTGKLFNGLNEGTGYGDDWQNYTNYPLVRLTNAAGDVYYCKTTLWNRIGAVMTDSAKDTTVFETPATLPAGTYSLVVVANGIPSNPTIFTTLQASLGSSQNILCNGTNSGTATVSVTGGISPYTYTWTGGQTSISATGLSAGTYTVTVHDNNDCVETATVVITQPATKVSATASVTAEAACGASNGSASSTVSGGTSPYTYSWTGGSTNSTATGLSAGTYTLNVSDKNGCTGTASVTITQSSSLAMSASATTNVKCNGSNSGTATATVSGGASPYTYSWTGGQTSATATGLSAGTYTVSITDHSGCEGTVAVTVTQPTALAVSGSVTANANCSGNTGSASSSVSGGTSPYTYAWTGGSTNSTATGLSAGTYTINITDNNGCTKAATVTITQTTSLANVSANATANVKCNGSNNGSATASTTSGTAPYTYSWTGGATTATATGLSAGTYIVTITDKNGCSGTASATISQPAALAASANTTANANCGGNNGSASSTVSGGVSPYTYAWTGGATTATANNLSAGIYTLTVTDNNGCAQSATVTITQTTSLSSMSASVAVNVTCNGSNNGSATASTTAGTAPYTYAWTGGASTATATGLSAGTYVVTITDKNGCSGTASATITQPAILAASANATGSANCGGNNGSASSTISGGTTPYTYSWTGGGTNATVNGLSAGNYTLTVTDKNGCTASAPVTITQTTSLSSVSASATANVRCNGSSDGSATASTTAGTAPYTYAWTGGASTATANGLSAGNYTVTVTDKNGCSGTASVTISQPAILAASANVTSNANCSGNTGGASSAVSGGTSPYTYSWTSGSTNATANGLSAGNYTLTVTDNNGCTQSAAVTITQSTGLSSVSATTTANVRCNGFNDGSVSVSASGGTAPYTYSWSSGAGSNATANGLSAGTYSVTVTDKNGCSGTAVATITAPAALNASTNVIANENCLGNDGKASATVNGGTSPYTYSWSGGAGANATATGLSAGNYTVTITDNNGCSASALVTITQAPAITNVATNVNSNVRCAGYSDGSATATISGGTAPYTYSWSGATGATATVNDLSAGTYTVTVTDNNGCSGTARTIITQPSGIISTMHAVNTTGSKACDGQVSVTVNGGTMPYTYTWSPGSQTTDTVKNECVGDYCCTVTDNNGCTQTTCITVTSNSTGVDDIGNGSTINMYPDPTSGSFTITGVLHGQIIELYNAIGQKLNSISASNTTVYFNIANQPDGIYLVRIVNTDGTVVTQKKLIKTQ